MSRAASGVGARAGAARAWDIRPRLRSTAVGRSRDPNVSLLVLVVLTVAVVALAVLTDSWIPLSAVLLPMVLGLLVLERRRFAVLVVVVLASSMAAIDGYDVEPVRLATLAVIVLAAGLLIFASHHSDLGGPRGLGEEMLIDLRDRLLTQSELPSLPEQWYAQALMRSAGGDEFAGDFIVAVTPTRTRLEVVVVDVSGKGLGAGTRALQLSGALGGLLGALPPHQFLPAANAYLLRQSWDEGFATAAHLSIDLDTGCYELRTAGHPPGLQFSAGSSTWHQLESGGPALGLLPGGGFAPATGQLRSGDALLLYTDGLVETPGRDFRIGIDKLLGEAERLHGTGWDGSAQRLLDRVESAHDDRAILLLHHR